MIKLNGQIVPKRLFGSVRVISKAHNGKFQAKTAEPSTENQTVVADPGYDALSVVTVKAATLQEKTATPSAVEQIVVPDIGVYGLAKVIVKAQGNHGLLQDKTVAPSIDQQIVRPDTDDGYYGLNSVTVKPVVKVSSVEVSSSDNTFTVNFEDESVVSGYVRFDADGLPTGLTDDQGNTVTFESGSPTEATDSDGNTIEIYGG